MLASTILKLINDMNWAFEHYADRPERLTIYDTALPYCKAWFTALRGGETDPARTSGNDCGVAGGKGGKSSVIGHQRVPPLDARELMERCFVKRCGPEPCPVACMSATICI